MLALYTDRWAQFGRALLEQLSEGTFTKGITTLVTLGVAHGRIRQWVEEQTGTAEGVEGRLEIEQ